jgi:hypothetical protein
VWWTSNLAAKTTKKQPTMLQQQKKQKMMIFDRKLDLATAGLYTFMSVKTSSHKDFT